ncbi:MAG TPA: MarR family transcriptional regulator [Gaiellaceae bacterium]
MPPEPDATRIASDLRVVLGRVVRRLRAEHTLSISLSSALARLEREGPSTASSLALAERVKPQSMAQTIGDAVGEGLVTRRPDPADGRQSLIEISDLGRAALDTDRTRRQGWLAGAIAERLTPDEQEILARSIPLLEQIADS